MTSDNFRSKYGPWALITGASSGIGAEFARQLARQKLHLILVARTKEKLEQLSQALSAQNDVEVKIIVADLSQREEIETILRQTEGIDVGLLVNNVGREDGGHFLDSDINGVIQTLDLNCRVPLELTHAFARKMATRQRGGIIFLSSVVAFQGVPYIASYAASKAYDLIFAEGLASELKQHNVDVLALCPGFAKTDLAPGSNFKSSPIQPMDVEPIVKTAIHSLGKKRVAIPGIVNKVLYFLGKFFQSRKMNTFSFGQVFRFVLRDKLKHSGKGKYQEPSLSINKGSD